MRLFGRAGRASVFAETVRETWRKSSYSYVNGDCIEVAGHADGLVRVRDSKDPGGSVLTFGVVQWDVFIGGIRGGGNGHR
jgi:hypothetical protein